MKHTRRVSVWRHPRSFAQQLRAPFPVELSAQRRSEQGFFVIMESAEKHSLQMQPLKVQLQQWFWKISPV